MPEVRHAGPAPPLRLGPRLLPGAPRAPGDAARTSPDSRRPAAAAGSRGFEKPVAFLRRRRRRGPSRRRRRRLPPSRRRPRTTFPASVGRGTRRGDAGRCGRLAPAARGPPRGAPRPRPRSRPSRPARAVVPLRSRHPGGAGQPPPASRADPRAAPHRRPRLAGRSARPPSGRATARRDALAARPNRLLARPLPRRGTRLDRRGSRPRPARNRPGAGRLLGRGNRATGPEVQCPRHGLLRVLPPRARLSRDGVPGARLRRVPLVVVRGSNLRPSLATRRIPRAVSPSGRRLRPAVPGRTIHRAGPTARPAAAGRRRAVRGARRRTPGGTRTAQRRAWPPGG